MSTAVEEKKAMTGEEVIDVVRTLSQSQGFYGRLLQNIEQLKRCNPDQYEELLDEFEAQQFKDSVDVVLYFEQ